MEREDNEMADSTAPALDFGWQLDLVGDPPPKIPVLLTAKGLKSHTAIIAQSGSGKSFALGRLLEEVLSRTRARVVILDPNSDFVRFGEMNEGAWQEEHLLEWFGENDTPDLFTERWESVGVKTLTAREPGNLPANAQGAHVSAISIRWGDLSLLEMASYLDFSMSRDPAEVYVLEHARVVARHNHEKSGEKIPYTLDHFRNSVDVLWGEVSDDDAYHGSLELPDGMVVKELKPDVCRDVSGRCFELDTYDVWDRDTEMSLQDHLDQMTASNSEYRVAVVDLPSLPKPESQLVVTKAILSSILTSARKRWAEALSAKAEDDTRTPTFIVVDEAHNLAPSEPNSPLAQAVTDLFITIAAEGRKYGLFLILVTQRPSRLHESVLSQCDNLCLLGMNNRHDLELVEKSFGFVPEGWVDRALEFGVGDCLLAGNFVERPVYAHVAPRRTVEGGRNLQDAHWTRDPLDKDTGAAT